MCQAPLPHTSHIDEKGKLRRDSEGIPTMIDDEEKHGETSFRFNQNEEQVTIASLLLSDFLCELRVPLLSTSFYEQFAIAQKRRDVLSRTGFDFQP